MRSAAPGTARRSAGLTGSALPPLRVAVGHSERLLRVEKVVADPAQCPQFAPSAQSRVLSISTICLYDVSAVVLFEAVAAGGAAQSINTLGIKFLLPLILLTSTWQI